MPSYMTKPKNINSGVPPLLNGFVCTYHPTAPCSSPKDTIYAKIEYELSLPYHYALVCQKLSNIRKLKQLLPRIHSLNVIWQWLNIQGQEGVDRRFQRQKVILATTTLKQNCCGLMQQTDWFNRITWHISTIQDAVISGVPISSVSRRHRHIRRRPVNDNSAS